MAISSRMHEIVTILAPLATLPLIGTMVFFAERARTRRALARLDTAALTDIGISARAARREAHKPFWR
ncbi:MAG: DUF1127 domain-containing protein [Paracoccaceae bacterium]